MKFERDFQDKLKLGSDSASVEKLNGELNAANAAVSDDTNPDDQELRICELGCGTGSTIRTICSVNTNKKTFVYCSDFSSNAIDILKVSCSVIQLHNLIYITFTYFQSSELF